MISGEGGWFVWGLQVPYDDAIDVVVYIFRGSNEIATAWSEPDVVWLVVRIEGQTEGVWAWRSPVTIDGNCTTDEALGLRSGESRNWTRKVRQREIEATEKALPDSRVP